jgi:cell surface protein SprA
MLWLVPSLRGLAQNPTAPADSLPQFPAQDSIRVKSGRRPLLNLSDRYGNRFSQPLPNSPFVPRDPRSLNTQFRVDSTGRLTIFERLEPGTGTRPFDYRPQETMTLEQYRALQNRRAYQDVLRGYEAQGSGRSEVVGRGLFPKFNVSAPGLDRVFGSNGIEFKPNGSVLIDLGYLHQAIDNPSIPVRQRRTGNFVFNQQAAINFQGKIGDKVNINTNFDTKASFNFENQLKLNYRSQEEDILQKIELGNTNMPLNSQLIPGVQNLFGAKAQLRFGRLDATVIAAQQRSKQETITLRGGTQGRPFEIRIDNYDENRHFFLSQYFRDRYEGALKSLPQITSGVTITRLEVYVTNRTQSTETLRNLVGLADIGEARPYAAQNPAVQPINPNSPADNAANGLFAKVAANPALRQIDNTKSELEALGFVKGVDFDILRGAKRLTANEYRFSPELGYVSLVAPLRNDEIIAVAYEYTYNGRKYKVGELTEDYQSRRDDEVLVLKLLKSATLRNRTDLPMWNLMMKNIYSLNTQSVQRQNFQLRIIYKDDLTGIDNPNLQEGQRLKDVPLVKVMGLDRLNYMGDPYPDGNFDWVEGVTIDSRNGRVIFPVLEPFGSNLRRYFNADEAGLASKYVHDVLYRSTLADAQQVADKNKFFLKGSFQSAGGAEVQLPFGVDERSVRVTAGGVGLNPGSDFIVEPGSGRVRIVNEAILSSGRDVQISWEKPDLFNNQIRTLLGTRLDYRIDRDFNVGATLMRLRETPPANIRRVALGNEPVNNTIFGFDANLRKESRWLTKALDALPLIQTKEMSTITFQGEYAQLLPGVTPRVASRSYLDDFEGARTVYDFTRQPVRWRLGATPQGFGTVNRANPLDYAYRRAKISVYTVDNTFYTGLNVGTALPTNITAEDLQNNYERNVTPQEVFQNRAVQSFNLPLSILDVAYFPQERGMYNYNPNLDPNGRLLNPRQNFGAVTRAITSDNDFDNSNIEILEFWMMDPFIDGANGVVKDGVFNQNNTTGGKLVINLGDISEDVIPDSRYNFENGLPGNVVTSGPQRNVDSTAWGRAPRQQFVINAFDNTARERQDIGLDGLNDSEEQSQFQQPFLSKLPANLTPEARQAITRDPSADDFQFYFSEEATQNGYKIVQRYKNYFNYEGNSPETTSGNTLTPASTTLPDIEDLNIDNTINDTEAYYQYEIDLRKGQLDVGRGYIVDKVAGANGSTWYLFRVPVRSPTGRVGGINSFKSIRFMRMVLTDWQQPVVLRFAQLQLTGFQYRKYLGDLTPKVLQEVPEPYDPQFKVTTVSVEENGPGTKNAGQIPYVVPPGYQRDRDITTLNNAQLNEQALNLSVTDLRDNDARAVFKNVNFDLLQYKGLTMSVHMDNRANESGTTTAFMRLGTDFTQNYYEISLKAGLKATVPGTFVVGDPDPEVIWPAENKFDFSLDEFRRVKAERDRTGANASIPFSLDTEDGKYVVSVVGRPDLSAVQVLMLGIRNPKTPDEAARSANVWFNELHASGFDQTSGKAAIGRADIKLADFANVSLTGAFKTYGFGGVQTRISDRERANSYEFGVVSSLALDKLMPEKWGLRVPLYISYDRRNVRPHFNPLDPDMPLEQSLNSFRDETMRRDYRQMVEENQTRRSINLSNVRKVRLNPSARAHFYDIENFTATYAFTDALRTSITVAEYRQLSHRGGLTYSFSRQPVYWEPFRNAKGWLERPFFALIKDFNLSLLPSEVSIRADMDRSFIKTQLRNSEADQATFPPKLTTVGVTPLFEKYWLFNRNYGATWNLSKSLTLNYRAAAQAIIDEPYGDLDTEVKRDSVRRSLLHFGRTKFFDQSITTAWQLPLNKTPLFDWMTAQAAYNVGVKFQANSLGLKDSLGVPFGNVIQNFRDRQLTGRIDFVALYNKLKSLRWVNSPRPPRRDIARSPGDFEDFERQPSQLLKTFARALLTVRGIQYSYAINESTILPGFLPFPRFFGNSREGAPGLPFVLGSQDDQVRVRAAQNGWLSSSTIQNQPFVQTVKKAFRATTALEPFRDFKVNVDLRYDRSDNYQEFYRPATSGGPFTSQSPVRSGNYSMSYLSFLTAFEKTDRNNYSANFERFREYRNVLLARLKTANPSGDAYNLNSQDVLIPAFFAAYSGKSPDKVKFSPFYKIPLPNWELRYDGLTNSPWFRKRFTSINIRHKYTSTYNVGSFVSSLEYDAAFVGLTAPLYPFATQFNAQGQFVPVYVMSVISFVEKFEPFIGVQFRTKGGLTGGLDYNQDRNVGLWLTNASVNEITNKGLRANVGFIKQNLRVPFRVNGRRVRLKNDLTFNCVLTMTDQRILQRKLDAETIPTAGNILFQFNPTVSYNVNRRLNVQVYFDRLVNNPLVSNSFRRATTAGGVRLRFNLAD